MYIRQKNDIKNIFCIKFSVRLTPWIIQKSNMVLNANSYYQLVENWQALAHKLSINTRIVETSVAIKARDLVNLKDSTYIKIHKQLF
jgi:hypothetical protein